MTFLTGRLKRKCLAPHCRFADAGRFKIAERGFSGTLGVSDEVPQDNLRH